MFAIIKTGGKQYKVAENDIIRIEKLPQASGDFIEFTEVLMMGDDKTMKVGSPLVTNAKVCGTVVDQIRDDKVIIFKKKRRHNYRRKNGHRQYLTVVRITDILAEGATPKPRPAAAKVQEKPKAAEKKEEVKAKAPVKKEEVAKAKAPAKKEAPKAKAEAPQKKEAAKATKAPAKKAAPQPKAKAAAAPKKPAPKAKKPTKK